MGKTTKVFTFVPTKNNAVLGAKVQLRMGDFYHFPCIGGYRVEMSEIASAAREISEVKGVLWHGYLTHFQNFIEPVSWEHRSLLIKLPGGYEMVKRLPTDLAILVLNSEESVTLQAGETRNTGVGPITFDGVKILKS